MGGSRWHVSRMMSMEQGITREGRAEPANEWLLMAMSALRTSVPASLWVKGALLLPDHTRGSSGRPGPGTEGEVRIRRLNTNTALEGLWSRMHLFTQQPADYSWNPRELGAVILPTFGLPRFFHECTNNTANNYRKEKWMVWNIRFQESTCLIHIHAKCHERKVIVYGLFVLTTRNKKECIFFSVILFTL